MNAVRRRTILALAAVFLLPVVVHAESLKVAVLDFWDARNQTTDARPDVMKLAEEIRAAVSADIRVSLVERDVTAEILKEWYGMLALGEQPPTVGDLSGADRYLFSSAERTPEGWVLRFRVVEYPSGRIVSVFVETLPSLRAAKARQAVIAAVLKALSDQASPREYVVAIGSFENATRYPILDKPAAQIRTLLEQEFSRESSVRLLERARTDRLVEEMRLMEVGGDASLGFDTHGMPGIFLIRGSVTLGTGVVRTSDMNAQLSVDVTAMDRTLVRKIFERQVSTVNLQPVARDVLSSFMTTLISREKSDVETVREAELHLEEALTLAAEARVHGIIPRDRRYPPIATTTGHQSIGRKEILEAAVREADNAIFLNPKLDEAWYIRAVCLRTDQIARYDEALDILLELSKRPAIDPDLRIKVLDQITHGVGRFMKKNSRPGRHEEAAEKAREELMRVDDDPRRRVNHAQNLVYMAVHRWKDPKKARDRGRRLLEMHERYRAAEKEYSLFGYGSVVSTYLDIGTLPGVDYNEILGDVLPYTKNARPEESLAIWRAIGLFHHRAGRREKAAEALERAAEDFKTTLAQPEILNEWHVYKMGLEAVQFLMEALQAMDMPDRAISIGEEFVRIPDDRLVDKYPLIEFDHNVGGIRYRLAELYESRHIYARALVLYREANRRKYRSGRGNIKSDIRRVQGLIDSASAFPLREVAFDNTGLPRKPVTAIASANGKIWVGLFPGARLGVPYFLFGNPPEITPGGGLYVHESDSGWSPIRVPGILSDVPVTSLAISDGRLWVGTYGEGVVSQNLATGEWTAFKEGLGLPMNSVLCLYPDINRIWIGFGDMSRGGLGWIDGRTLKVYSFSSERRKLDAGAGPPAAPVTAITRLDDMLYAAEYRVGVKIFPRNSREPNFAAIVHQHSDTGALLVTDLDNRTAALLTYNQKVWIGCFTAGSGRMRGKDHANGGIAWLDKKMASRSYFEEQEGLPTNSVTSLVTHRDMLVAGTNEFDDEGGLAVYDEAADRWIGTGGFRVLSLHSDGDKLYVGTSKGIKVYGR